MGVFKRTWTNKDGKKAAYWYIRYRVKGKLYMESVGRVGKVTKAMAEALLAERKRQIRQGKLEEIAVEVPTLEEFAKEFIEYSRDVAAKRSWKRDEVALNQILPVLGKYKLSEITPKDIQDYQRKRLKEGRRPATINRDLVVLSSLFSFAKQRRKFFGDSPVGKVRSLPAYNQVERILTPKEESDLLAACPAYLRPIIIAALNTGMRKSELLTLKWSDVDLENDVITLRQTHTKSKKLRRVPINSVLKKTLLEQRLVSGSQDYVFLGSHGKPYKRQDSLKRAFSTACKKAGIEGLRFHDLRHTAATRMIEAGAPLVAVSRVLGHQDIRTTMRYAHPEDSLRDAVERLAFSKEYSKKYSNEFSGES